MDTYNTTEELEQTLGEQLRATRLRRNLKQAELAQAAGVAVNSIRNLEQGKGATVTTLVRVARALDLQDWLQALQPQVSVSPLQMLRSNAPRQRARSPRSSKE